MASIQSKRIKKSSWYDFSYQALASEIIYPFTKDSDKDELSELIHRAYGPFSAEDIVPMKCLNSELDCRTVSWANVSF